MTAAPSHLSGTHDALKEYISDWARIIYDATGDQTKVDRAILLADLNGMFDPVKVASLTPQAQAGDLISRLLAMPSSLNDACRTMEEAAGVLRGAAQRAPFYGAQCPSYPNCNGGCGLGCTKEIERSRHSAQGSVARGDVTLNEDQAYHLFLIADTAARNERGKNKAVNHLRELLLPAYRTWHDANPGTVHPALSLPSTSRTTGPLVPWELDCQREVCAAPECECPATSTEGK